MKNINYMVIINEKSKCFHGIFLEKGLNFPTEKAELWEIYPKVLPENRIFIIFFLYFWGLFRQTVPDRCGRTSRFPFGM